MFFDLDFEGESKQKNLREAVDTIEPKSLIHIGATNTLPYGICYEMARTFWGTRPDFQILTLGGALNVQLFVFGGLVKKVITSYVGNYYPFPSPSPVIQQSYLDGSVEYENWSLLSICQRLMAGAMNLGFLPTNSIVGSSMEENEGFEFISDPFTGKRKGVIREIRPDVAIYHGWCADKEGNTIVFNPSAEGVVPWGAFASKRVIVTVEKIVDSEFIRKHAYLVKIPGYLVDAVVELPFGAHPSSLYVPETFGCGYAEDYDFLVDYRNASMRPETMEKWVNEWVLSVDHAKYLEKLGYGRLLYLTGKAKSDAWKVEFASKKERISKDPKPTEIEKMIMVAARRVAEKCKEKDYRNILAGIGDSNLAAWMAYYMLRENGFDINLVAEIGFYGYSPRPANPFVFNMANIPTCRGLFGAVEVLGSIMGREGNRGIAVLGAAQVDKHGNVNSTLIPNTMFLFGSGGANDVASTAEEIVVLVRHSPLRLVEKVPYTTANGKKVTMVVTTKGVFEKFDEELVLTSCITTEGKKKEEMIEEIVSETGWKVKLADKVTEEELPPLEKLMLLRYFDPEHSFLK